METALTISDEHGPMNMVAVLRLAPSPDPELLRAAFDHVQRRHPALRSRIVKQRRTYRFEYEGVPPIPLSVVDAAAPDDWIAATETGLNAPVPSAGPLIAATLLSWSDGADLVVAIHHAIVDAASGANMLAEVLDAYAALAEGAPVALDELAVPPAADDLFPAGYHGFRFRRRGMRFALRTLGPEMRYRRAMKRAGGPKVDRSAKSQVYSAALDAGTTNALSQAARRRRLTVASVVQAAALASVHRLRHDARPVPLRTFSFPDQRPYLEPAQTPEPLAAYLALTWQDVPMAGADLWAVAATVQERVEASVRGGAKFVTTALTVPVMRMTMATKKMRMGNVAVSHTGITRLDTRYGPLVVSDLRAFVSSLIVGPELAMRTGVLHGRLLLDVVTLDTDTDRAGMQRLADEVVATLAEAADS